MSGRATILLAGLALLAVPGGLTATTSGPPAREIAGGPESGPQATPPSEDHRDHQEPAPAAAGEPLTLAELEQLAIERNPTLNQARARIESAEGRARQAGMLPNPVMGYVAEEVSRGEIIRGGEHGFFVEQRIPLGGKLGLSRRIVEQEVAEATARLEAQRLRVLTDVRLRFYEALAAARRVDLRESLARLAAEAVTVSRQLFNVGAADRPDVLEAEVEARQAELELVAARNDRLRTWAELSAVVGDPSLAPRPLAGDLDRIPELDRAAITDRLLGESPEVQAARASVDRADAALTRAKREPVPDLFLKGGPLYNRERLEANFQVVGWELSLEVGLSIPLFNRNQGAVAAGAADLTRARRDAERLDLSLRSRLARAFSEYDTAREATRAYAEDILPRARQAYELYLTRFQQMAAAYPQVLIAQRSFFQASERHLDALERAWGAALRLQGFLLDDSLGRADMGDGMMGQGDPEDRE